jgi:hypothetical protein
LPACPVIRKSSRRFVLRLSPIISDSPLLPSIVAVPVIVWKHHADSPQPNIASLSGVNFFSPESLSNIRSLWGNWAKFGAACSARRAEPRIAQIVRFPRHFLATPPRANHAEASFLLGGIWCSAGNLSVLMVFLPFLVAALHFVPFRLLLGVQKRADLVVRRFSEIHHLGSAFVLRGI